MKFKFEQVKDDEKVVVYAKEKNTLVEQIENLCVQDEYLLVGYQNGRIKEINPIEVECFISNGDKVYALINKEEYLIKKRLYELNELLGGMFVYINQSCLANFNLVDHFDASIGGTLIVVFKSGYKDYVSRRQIKNVKERIGKRKWKER